jgi:hypothetical protein
VTKGKVKKEVELGNKGTKPGKKKLNPCDMEQDLT